MEKDQEMVYTEMSLADSNLYKSFNNNAQLTSTMLAAMKNSVVIDSSYIQEQLMQIKRTRISPLMEHVLDAYNTGKIMLLYSTIAKVPQMVPFFATKMQGEVKVIIFTNNYGSISQSSLNSEEKYLNISMKDLYVLLEGAYVNYVYITNPNRLSRSFGLMKVCTNIYTSMIVRILNKEYSISMEEDTYNKICFCLGRFFLDRVWMSPNHDVNISYAFSTIKGGINRADFMPISDLYDTKNIANIDDLLNFMREFSPRVSGINFRYFIQSYINLYKAPALFGLECLPYFLFSVEASMLGSFIINQPMISDVTKNISGMNTFYPELVKAIV